MVRHNGQNQMLSHVGTQRILQAQSITYGINFLYPKSDLTIFGRPISLAADYSCLCIEVKDGCRNYVYAKNKSGLAKYQWHAKFRYFRTLEEVTQCVVWRLTTPKPISPFHPRFTFFLHLFWLTFWTYHYFITTLLHCPCSTKQLRVLYTQTCKSNLPTPHEEEEETVFS